MAGEEDDGQVGTPADQGIEDIQSAQAGHAHVEDDTTGGGGRTGGEKVLAAGVGGGRDAAGLEQPRQGVADGLVVVHQVGFEFAHGDPGRVKVNRCRCRWGVEVGVGPQAAAMEFDDRAADRQPHPMPWGLVEKKAV